MPTMTYRGWFSTCGQPGQHASGQHVQKGVRHEGKSVEQGFRKLLLLSLCCSESPKSRIGHMAGGGPDRRSEGCWLTAMTPR